MRLSTSIIALSASATAIFIPRTEATQVAYTEGDASLVQDALYDGKCFYPKPAPQFNLTNYLGTWYQVAGTPFGPTAGARCVTAQYSLNDNGTVKVLNTASVGPQPISIVGAATPVSNSYAAGGAFQVSFPGQPATPCPGPNYIVQEYCTDHAIVQTQNWTTLYILSRERNPGPTSVQAWIERAVALGSDASSIIPFNQTGC